MSAKILPALAEDALERNGEKLSVIFEGRKLTNLEMYNSGRSLQRGLEDLGLGSGKIVGMSMANDPGVLIAFQAIFRSGATVVPAMSQLTPEELRFVFSDTKAVGVLTDSILLFKVQQAVKGLDHVKWIAVLGGKDKPDANPPEYSMDTLMKLDPQTKVAQIDPVEDVALMLYTSGTTGKPKGVMLTHANLIAAAEAGQEASEYETWTGPRVGLNALPLAHMFGIGVMNGGFLTPKEFSDGYTVIMRMFEPLGFMKNIQEYKVDSTAAVPTILSLILNHPRLEEFDLTSLQEIVVGAAPLPVELARTFMDRFGCFLREGYGMTENSAIAVINRKGWGYQPGSAGKEFATNEVRIVDADDNFLPVGERGEIVTKGPTTMKGYYNRPEATAEAMRGGWLHTGDVGYLDEEGWLYVVDRVKDMILRGGENIYPAELEDIIYRHPAIAEAAVVGLPDPVYGERVVAYAVVKQGKELTAEELIAHVCDHTHKFKAPEEVRFIDMLPKSGVGKILRRELRDQAIAETADAK